MRRIEPLVGWPLMSDALKNFYAPYPAAAKNRAALGDNRSRTDKASRPIGRHVAIECPVPRSLEEDPRPSKCSNQIIRYARTGATWAADKNSAEVSASVNPQHLQYSASLGLPPKGTSLCAELVAVDARMNKKALMMRRIFESSPLGPHGKHLEGFPVPVISQKGGSARTPPAE
jgi:hypothetical protein